MATVNKIESEIAALPPHLQTEVLDFVQFIKQRHGLPVAPESVAATAETGDSPLFQALDVAGFVGCIETGDQLSTIYKTKLDFSTKRGTLP